jgi:hypothetical protein
MHSSAWSLLRNRVEEEEKEPVRMRLLKDGSKNGELDGQLPRGKQSLS